VVILPGSRSIRDALNQIEWRSTLDHGFNVVRISMPRTIRVQLMNTDYMLMLVHFPMFVCHYRPHGERVEHHSDSDDSAKEWSLKLVASESQRAKGIRHKLRASRMLFLSLSAVS
jgi:hypothetical protein